MPKNEISKLEKLLVQVRRIEEHRTKGAEIQIQKTYKQLLEEIRHFLADEYTKFAENDELTFAMLQQNNQYARFLEEVEQKINSIAPTTKALIRSTVSQTYETVYNGMIESVKKAADTGTSLAGLKACTPEILKRAIDNPIAGLTLTDTLEKDRKNVIYEIKKNLGIGLTNGDRYTTMAKRVSRVVEGDYKKAVRIVRTETHRVRESGNHDAASHVDQVLKDSNSEMVMVKTWKTMNDERVRPSGAKGKAKKYNHKKMDGISVPVDEEFTLPSGAKTMAPGQSGIAGEDINCRCYLSYDLVEKVEKSSIVNVPKQVVKKPKDDIITDEDIFAIHEHMSFKSYTINEKLRKGHPLSKEDNTYINALDIALDKMPTFSGNLSRSLSFSFSEDLDDFLREHKVGKTITYEAYTPMTKGDTYNSDGQVQIFVVNSSKAKDISHINEMEQEVMYERGTEFEIINCVKKDGKYYFLFEEI